MYHMLRFGAEPEKIFRIAKYAFAGEYDDKTIYKWLRTFTWRFFAQQFKRSCLPDGPKVGSVAVSPRGDLRMPSDATAREWLETEYNGGFYLHDASTSTYLPYCYAYDLTRLATEGLFFLKNYNNQAPKHLTTFMDDVIEYISYMSNRSSGAVGIPNVLIWTYYFWKRDCESGHFIKNPEYYICLLYTSPSPRD